MAQRYYEGKNPGLDATKTWREMVLVFLPEKDYGEDQLASILNEVAHFPNGRIPSDVGQAVVDYLNYCDGAGPEPEWHSLLMDNPQG